MATNTKLARSVQPRRVHFAFEEKKQRERKWQERAVNLSGARTRWSHLSVDCRPGQIQIHRRAQKKFQSRIQTKIQFQRSLKLQMVLIVDYLSTSQCAFSAPSANHFPFHPRKLEWSECREKVVQNAMLWWCRYFNSLTIICICWFLYLYLFQKVVQNADCDDEADFAFCIFCDDEADMQIGLKAQRGKMWGGEVKWSKRAFNARRELLTRSHLDPPVHHYQSWLKQRVRR